MARVLWDANAGRYIPCWSTNLQPANCVCWWIVFVICVPTPCQRARVMTCRRTSIPFTMKSGRFAISEKGVFDFLPRTRRITFIMMVLFSFKNSGRDTIVVQALFTTGRTSNGDRLGFSNPLFRYLCNFSKS